MLRLFRMYRFVKLVDKKIDEQNIDDFYKEANDNRFTDHVKRHECLKDFKLIAKHKEYKAKKICMSAKKSGYLDFCYGHDLTITPDGERLIEGFGWGLFREFVTNEWRFLLILASIIGFIFNPFEEQIRTFILERIL